MQESKEESKEELKEKRKITIKPKLPKLDIKIDTSDLVETNREYLK